eukprot:TRINITY_DN7353_c0_g1_i1.p1 TRINITY_DN7353_c0_g1~~TRINITY_DN7353_c0_g1_i1.p1  ORF type:complete len:654 (+),score=89.22 TRINITY_DN7353_c0_g1_i1:167-2128(+)
MCLIENFLLSSKPSRQLPRIFAGLPPSDLVGKHCAPLLLCTMASTPSLARGRLGLFSEEGLLVDGHLRRLNAKFQPNTAQNRLRASLMAVVLGMAACLICIAVTLSGAERIPEGAGSSGRLANVQKQIPNSQESKHVLDSSSNQGRFGRTASRKFRRQGVLGGEKEEDLGKARLLDLKEHVNAGSLEAIEGSLGWRKPAIDHPGGERVDNPELHIVRKPLARESDTDGSEDDSDGEAIGRSRTVASDVQEESDPGEGEESSGTRGEEADGTAGNEAGGESDNNFPQRQGSSKDAGESESAEEREETEQEDEAELKESRSSLGIQGRLFNLRDGKGQRSDVDSSMAERKASGEVYENEAEGGMTDDFLITDVNLKQILLNVSNARRELIVSTFEVHLVNGSRDDDFEFGMTAFNYNWAWHLRAAGVPFFLLIGMDSASCEATRKKGIPCYVNSYNWMEGVAVRKGRAVALKWLYLLKIVRLGFHPVFLDNDAVVLKDPFAAWDPAFDFQALSDTRPTSGLLPVLAKNFVCGVPFYTFPYPCTSTGVMFVRATEATRIFLEEFVMRLDSDGAEGWEQATFQQLVLAFLIDVAGASPLLRFRVLPLESFHNVGVLVVRRDLRLPSPSAIVHCGYIHGGYAKRRSLKLLRLWKEADL